MNDDFDAPALRLPACEIEQAVRRAIARWLRDQSNLQKLTASRRANEKTKIFEMAERLANDIEALPVSAASMVLEQIALRVSVSEHQIMGTFEPATALGLAADEDAPPIEATFEIALDRRSYGHEPRLRLQPAEPDPLVRDERLVELLGRAFAAREQLLSMDGSALSSVKTTRLRHLQRLARLSYLAPCIIRNILNGTQPKGLISRSLWRMADLPIGFAGQRAMLGFSQL